MVASMPKAEIREVTWSVGLRLAIGSLLAMLLAVAATLGCCAASCARWMTWCVRPRHWVPAT